MANSQRPYSVRLSTMCASRPSTTAISTENGMPNTRPWPMKTKARGRLPIELPSSVSSVVTQMAAPEKNIIVVSVTMKGGMSSRVTQAPLKAPMAPPTARKVRMPAVTAMAGAAPPSGPSSVITAAAMTLDIASTEVADRSMPATISTKVWPMAMMSRGIIAPRMSAQVAAASSSGAIGAISAT